MIDRMATKQNPWATGTATAIYVILIPLLSVVHPYEIEQITAQKLSRSKRRSPCRPCAGPWQDGRGRRAEGIDGSVTKGKMPEDRGPAEKADYASGPQLPNPPDAQKDLKMTNNNMPNFGDPNSPLPGNSMGRGSGTGMGNGTGSGIGSGSGGGMGGGVRQVGGGVKGPVIIYQPEPEFSEEARKAKFMGVVTVSLIVGADGKPQNVHVTRGVGMGLDENAVAAVKQYRFKPATGTASRSPCT